MRILHIVNDATLGGAQTFIVQLASSWDKGDEVHLVVLLNEGPLSDQYHKKFASVHYLDVRSKGPFSAARVFRNILRDMQPDLVHSHLLQSDLVNLVLTPSRIRRVSTVHTTGMSSADPIASRLTGRLVGALSSRFSGVIACNSACYNYLRSEKYRTSTVVISNGISPQPLSPSATPSRTLISLARLHPMKDHASLLRAFVQAIQGSEEVWNLRCFGADVSYESPALQTVLADPLVRSAVDSGIIELNGPTLRSTEELKQSAALVISSSYGEASPMVAIEAASVGVPLISTRVGGAADLVLRDSLVAEPGDAASLARSITAFFQMSDDERRLLGRQTYERIEQDFDIDLTSAAYREYYRGLSAKRS